MARSRRSTPIVSITNSTSEKQDKRQANRNCRAALRRALRLDADGMLPVLRDVNDPWCMAKDGRHWIGKRFPEMMRK